MPCYKPLTAWRSTENTSNGKKAIVFQPSENSTTKIQLPCGQCIGCRLTRSYNWAMRCTNHAQLHDQNSFITLTYSDHHLPWDGSLTKSHFQKFIKRLRKQYPQKISYYMAGEYGDQLQRPHYHACLFGVEFRDREPWKDNEGLITYTSESLEDLWGFGFATVTDFSFETAAYAARYCTKKITGDLAQNHYETTHPVTGEILNLQPEYNNMSLKPGIGKQWLEKYRTDVYPSDYLIRNGSKTPIPRYYEKLLNLSEDDMNELKLRRKKQAAKRLAENTPERLAAREKVKHLTMKSQLTRTYENEA
ncbi:replication initiator protein [Microviridae sp.]|nr:replication initiator protein [Microviridae sp.]